MKRTTIWINEELLKEALEVTGARSKREVIEAGLRLLVRWHNKELLRKELGTFELDLSLEELEKLRSAQ